MDNKIRPEELNIGNWFNDGEGNHQVEEICSYDMFSTDLGVRYRNRSNWVHNEDVIPIPLTEEWLIRGGFEWDVFYQKHTNGRLCIHWVNKVCLVSWCKAHHDDILRYEYPKYVHQLQNLYFSLTGEELKFK
jgi:hypothetical protein